LGTEHTEYLVEPNVARLLPLMVWHFDQPFADHSCLPTYELARETRRDVTVALTGDGGDEAFVGYERIQRLTTPGRGLLGWGAAHISDALPPMIDPRHPLSRARRLAFRTSADAGRNYRLGLELFPEQAIRRLYTPEMASASSTVSSEGLISSIFQATADTDSLWQAQAADYQIYLPGALLPKMDAASMAASLEARSPMLDQVFIDSVASLPSHLKLRGGVAKGPLCDAFRDVIPPEVLSGSKRGFGLPLDDWFRAELATLATALLTTGQPSILRILRREPVRRLVDSHIAGKADHGPRIFALIWLELWLRAFIDSVPSLAPPADINLQDLT
jgi:asparagine synthase (glutamine-hydrolysing)